MILALDIAQKVGFASSDGRSGVIDLSRYDDHATQGIVFEKWLRSEFSKATLWVMERPFGRGSQVYTVNGLLWTAHIAAKRLGIARAEVNAPTWRKAVLGRGRAKKADAIEWCRKHGFNPQDDNEAEAICILAWARKCVEVPLEAA